jgi:hypothetical protein
MQSIDFTKRQLSRARATAEAALATGEGQQVALKILAPDMIAQCDAFEAADAAVRSAQVGTTKEVGEGKQALETLRPLFDQTREVVAAKLGVTYESASAFATPDDLLNAAEDLEATLEGADQSWAGPLLASFAGTVDATAKEQSEAVAARKTEQKAQLERAQAEGVMRPVLVQFRRAVRATFGASSREYRELLDRRSRGKTDDPAPAAS